jgi:hypothetical protein
MNLRKKLAKWSSGSLSVALVIVAILLILIAVFINNPWIKAGVLAYELLP